MKKINIILAGYGRVGKAFVRLVQEKQDFCLNRYHLQIGIEVVLNSRGGLFLVPDKKGMGSLSDLISGVNNPALTYGALIKCKLRLS